MGGSSSNAKSKKSGGVGGGGVGVGDGVPSDDAKRLGGGADPVSPSGAGGGGGGGHGPMGGDGEGGAPQAMRRMPIPLVKSSFKVVMMGGEKVGKSSIYRRFLTNEYSAEALPPTVRADIGLKMLQASPQNICLEIWDLPSSEGLMDLMKDRWFDGVDGAIIVADCNNLVTFAETTKWNQKLMEWQSRKRGGLPLIPVAFFANKSDRSEVKDGDVKSKADREKFNCGILMSCARGENVDRGFGLLIHEMCAQEQRRLSVHRSDEKDHRGVHGDGAAGGAGAGGGGSSDDPHEHHDAAVAAVVLGGAPVGGLAASPAGGADDPTGAAGAPGGGGGGAATASALPPRPGAPGARASLKELRGTTGGGGAGRLAPPGMREDDDDDEEEEKEEKKHPLPAGVDDDDGA